MNLIELRNLIIGTALIILLFVGLNTLTAGSQAGAITSQWSVTDFYADHHDPLPPAISMVITATGGILLSNDLEQRITIQFPAGAVSDPTLVTYQYQLPQPSGHLAGMDRFFRLEASQGASELLQFDQPVYITVRYPASTVIIKSTAGLYWFNGSDWVTDGITIIERTDTYLTATTNHFTLFAVLGETKQTYLPLIMKSSR